MRKIKKIIVSAMFITILLLSSCGKENYPDLPDNAIAFKMSSYEDKEHDDELFFTIEYNGRTYLPYGVINNKFTRNDIDKCIGYIVQDENVSSVPDRANKNWRIYTLVNDTDNNFLMDNDVESVDLMPPPKMFYRAIDTKGKNIEIPACMDDLEYPYWE